MDELIKQFKEEAFPDKHGIHSVKWMNYADRGFGKKLAPCPHDDGYLCEHRAAYILKNFILKAYELGVSSK